MRSDVEQPLSEHRSPGVAVEEGPNPASSPYRRFMESLEDLALVVSLHGTASVEAAQARAHVSVARAAAVEVWRRKRAAA